MAWLGVECRERVLVREEELEGGSGAATSAGGLEEGMASEYTVCVCVCVRAYGSRTVKPLGYNSLHIQTYDTTKCIDCNEN